MALVIGADRVAADFVALAAKWQVRERAIVTHYGMVYLTRVRAAASGRPGPRVITGDYRRSINMEPTRTVTGGAAVVIGTSAPQARRLEYGFVGVDSIGRHYSQRALPHWEPPLRLTIDEMQVAIEAAITEMAA